MEMLAPIPSGQNSPISLPPTIVVATAIEGSSSLLLLHGLDFMGFKLICGAESAQEATSAVGHLHGMWTPHGS